MSGIYDNWERLAAAVLKRQQIWELCHDHSRTPSICSQSSDLSSSRYDDDLMSSPLYQECREGAGLGRATSDLDPSSTDENSELSEIKHEWTEQYEAGVYLTFVALGDGSINVKRARFSRRKFKEEEAETWWLKNRDKVYEKYNNPYGLAPSGNITNRYREQAGSVSNLPVPDRNEESRRLGGPGRNEQPLTRRELYENVKSRNSEVEGSASQIADEWIEIYEPGVCVTIRDYRDGSRDIIRIRCSRRRFQVHQAEAWLHENIEKVCKNYNARPLRLGEENNFSY
ncbi:PH, RCC1 and FYVE domains-containing protein 1 [Sesamum alatum]|uniref:PH, RCC1 and FYVE domains-containing protein 1 n=1 Tax=Sesamum alatum TaxID=300844 RepID=A0AAE1YKT0_9LAMI|nr:PH, RCC1 and FYVE domains-containing protein 1 [Sesamum alatum]